MWQGLALPAEAGRTETWGLRATRTHTTDLTGAGVRVAVLDTGLDLSHPDFQDGRVVATASFVGQDVQDVPTPGVLGVYPGNRGHGTHCIGVACGPKAPSGGSAVGRYGVATEAQILVGKVLTNQGVSVTGSILQGIQWAIQHKADIISMSFSSRPNPFGDVYAQAAELATQKGVALIAAVGNDSNRPTTIAPVGSPANNLRILGVGAIDEHLQIAPFSNRGVIDTAAAVDVVGPGVGVYSSLPVSSGSYGFLSGTSMATPYVAGIAALLKQENPKFGPMELLLGIVRMARKLRNIDPNDMGAGIVQAPH
jgi:subtilisin family serine protease